MSAPSSILFLITARGGSKGLPGKNLREIAGLSLVGYKARSARRSRHCARLIISTDSPEIQAEARRHGAEAPFLRPAELASDTASSADVVLHAMEWLEREEGRRYDAIMLLEPSSPFARADHYDAAVALFQERRANLVVGVRETEVSSVFVGPLGADGSIASIVGKVKARTALRRQEQAREVTMNGALYLLRWEWFARSRRIYGDEAGSYGILMDRPHSLEIETPMDLAWGQFLVEQGLVDLSHWGVHPGSGSPS
jgi:CMP-N,N'-diacetyllegionaminic acid synthase